MIRPLRWALSMLHRKRLHLRSRICLGCGRAEASTGDLCGPCTDAAALGGDWRRVFLDLSEAERKRGER